MSSHIWPVHVICLRLTESEFQYAENNIVFLHQEFLVIIFSSVAYA
jgi:hypothetical protein